MSKIQGNGKFYFQKACVILLMVSAVVFTLAMRAEAVNSVRGQVVNAVSGKPIAGVTVEISIADVKQSTEPVLTDENGRFEFPDLGDLQPPYRLDFTKRKYKAKTIQPVDSGADLSVQLEPGNIQRPFKPLVFSGPRSVRITWDANPEYNIAGYNIYRKSGTNNVWERLNNPNSKPYEGYMKELEYVDEQIQVGVMYQYAIQAVSDVDRYTGLSDASDWVQGEYLTVFFPEKVTYKEENLYLWEKDPQNPQEWQIRIPVCSKSVYDVSATSIQIDSELPGGLIIDPKSITVEPSGITAGMMMGANAIVNENKINVRIAAAGVEAESLYGSGILFNIIAKPNRSLIDECGLLHLIPDDGGGNGVRLYDVISDMTSPIKELLLRDGQLCVTGSCVHGDANNDGIVDEQDARYVLAYWVKKVQGNNCFPGSADINLDGLVDSADSSLILRWLEGKSITPPKIKADVKSTGDYIAGLKMLADGGSMSAQAQLASLQKENVGVKVWFRGTLEGSAGSDKWIAIVADEVSNAAGFEFVLNYDPEFAEIKQIKPVTAANIWRWDYAVYQTETGSTSARITGASDENLGITGEVELVKVKFKIKRTGKGDIKFVQVQIHDKYGHTPRFDDPLAPKILDPEPVEVEGEGEPTEGEGIIEGAIEGVPEGFPEGVVEGEGEGSIENVSVPNVIGKPVEEASGIIQEASLSVGAIIGICTNDFPPGTVVDQIPSGENTVEIGTIVDLLISCGPCVTIPDVVNLNVDMAEQEILGAGLRVGEIIEVCNDNAPAGLVMAQEPAAIEYSCIGINTEEVSVDLWVSSGPCTVNELTITQEVTGAGVIGNNYIPGNNATVRVTFNNETGSLIYALGLTCVLPAGWQYQGGDNQPPIAPAVGTVSDGVNPLEFVWIYVPSFPLILEFNVSIPSGAEGPCSIQTQGLYRTFSSGQLYTNIATTDFAGAIVQEGTPEGVIEGAVEGPPEGVVEGTPEGVVEGTPEGVVEGMPEGVIEGVPEGVVEGIPEGIVEGQPEGVIDALIISQEVSGPGVISYEVDNYYIPGSNTTVKITINKNIEEIITALGLTCILPAGWQYQGGNNQPPIGPDAGTVSDGVNPLEFVWIYVPPFPLILEFNVGIPSGAEGPCSIQTQGLYRTFSSGQLYTNIAKTDFAGAIVPEGTPEGVIEGVVEGTPEGVVEGTPEGIVEGTPEGVVEGIPEGVIEGVPEGVVEGIPEGVVEGQPEGQQLPYNVRGKVINSISKKPIPGVLVEISIADKASTEPVLTDANGNFEFPDLGTLQPPYLLQFTKRKYKPKMVQPVNSGENITVELEPGNIQKPVKPRVYSGPRSVRVGWDANPEYNIAGYNVYRRTVDANGNALTAWTRLNNPGSQPYENYISGLEYTDGTVRANTYYQYAIQAVSDVDRYTDLSDNLASEVVKGQFLTVFFPEEVSYKDAGLYLWERNPDNPGQWQVRIPVNSKSVYDVSATSIQIDSELPSELLLDWNNITVEPSGITVGMMMSANVMYQGDKLNVRIAAAGPEGQSLYGSGTLFNIIARPNLGVSGTQCGPLHLIPDDGLGNGVRLYDVITGPTTPLELELEDGQLCVTGACIHGDADNNKTVEKADAQYVLDYWVKKNSGNDCLRKSGDINMDGLVDSADSSLIQRWLAGKDITPPKVKGLVKSYDEYLMDVAWLADAGSMSAEAILADLEKADVKVYVWLSGKLVGVANEEKVISVYADNVSNVSGFKLMLNFDKDYAEVLNVELGDVASDLILSWKVDGGNLRISASGEENLGAKGSVELVKVTFKMKQRYDNNDEPITEAGDAELVFAQAEINDKFAYVPMFDAPKVPCILPSEPTEGEGTPEGTLEGTPEGVVEGTPEGTLEGTPEGTTEGVVEGTPEGTLEGTPEGTPEGVVEGTAEGTPEGTPEGAKEGETPATNKVQVPDVVGKTKDEATNAITLAGLVVGKVTEDYSDTVPAGKVISQSPSAGTEVEKGSAVDLVISKGKKRRFIVSCGAGNGSGGSYMADMMLLGLVSGLLIARKGRKVMSN